MNNDIKNKLAEASEWLSREYGGLRTSRATPAVLDGIFAEAYGSKMPIKQLANISAADARTLFITPYDPGLLKNIEKAVADSSLGLSVGADEQRVRVSFPELTSERRQQLVKAARAKLEEARISVRRVRDEAWDEIQRREKEKEITEDDKYRLKEELQKTVDEANKSLAEMAEKKEKEILS